MHTVEELLHSADGRLVFHFGAVERRTISPRSRRRAAIDDFPVPESPVTQTNIGSILARPS